MTNSVSNNAQQGASGREDYLSVCCAIIEYQGKTLAVQRGEAMALPLKWEFPGGKMEPGESEIECLQREIREELGIEITPVQRLTPVDYQYPGFNICLIPYIATCEQASLQLKEHKEYRWLSQSELTPLDWAPADLPVLNEYLGG